MASFAETVGDHGRSQGGSVNVAVHIDFLMQFTGNKADK
jgi:hypothetical protein